MSNKSKSSLLSNSFSYSSKAKRLFDLAIVSGFVCVCVCVCMFNLCFLFQYFVFFFCRTIVDPMNWSQLKKSCVLWRNRHCHPGNADVVCCVVFPFPLLGSVPVRWFKKRWKSCSSQRRNCNGNTHVSTLADEFRHICLGPDESKTGSRKGTLSEPYILALECHQQQSRRLHRCGTRHSIFFFIVCLLFGVGRIPMTQSFVWHAGKCLNWYLFWSRISTKWKVVFFFFCFLRCALQVSHSKIVELELRCTWRNVGRYNVSFFSKRYRFLLFEKQMSVRKMTTGRCVEVVRSSFYVFLSDTIFFFFLFQRHNY